VIFGATFGQFVPLHVQNVSHGDYEPFLSSLPRFAAAHRAPVGLGPPQDETRALAIELSHAQPRAQPSGWLRRGGGAPGLVPCSGRSRRASGGSRSSGTSRRSSPPSRPPMRGSTPGAVAVAGGGGACIGGGGNAQPGHCEHVIVEARLRFCVFLQPRCLPLNTVSGSHDDEEQLTTHSHSWCSHPTRPYHSRCIGYLHFFSCPVNIFTKKWEPSYSPQPWGRPGGAVGGRLGGPPQRGPLAAARARPQGQSRCAGMGKGGGSGLLGNQWKL